MNENAEPEKLDNDWLAYFNEYAKNVNREDAKILWGKVLARECNNCGCIPKKLIHILSVMSKNDAESFEKLCGFMVERNLYAGKKDNIIIIGGNNPDLDNLLKSTKLTHNQITDLDAIGLVKRNAYAYRNTVEGKGDIKKAHIVYYYHGRTINIGNLEHEMPIGFVILTKSGEILADLIEKKELKGYLEYLGRYYVSKGFEVYID